MRENLIKIKEEFKARLEKIDNLETLRDLELKYLSRKGELSSLLKGLKDLSLDLKREIGQLANKVKRELEDSFNKKKEDLSDSGEFGDNIDLSLPGKKIESGSLHPVSIIRHELEDFFASLGFMILDSPELDSEYYNFDSLNIPEHHPARDMQDTFFVDAEEKDETNRLVMRTHTSNAQVRAIEEHGAPLKAIISGRVFRNEATDARHEHTFEHLEGIVIDKDINFSHLKGLLESVGHKLYGPETKLRMRPKYYPFVEPGSNGEYTCFLCQGKGCKVCKQSGWLEVMGCGLIHPKVLEAGGLDKDKYTGLAFGFGLSRLVMLRYGINDVRLFNSGDLKFLKQF